MSTATLDAQTAMPQRFRPADGTSAEAETRHPDGILPSPPFPILGKASEYNSPARSTAQSPEAIKGVDPLIRLYGGQGPVRRFKVLQQWEGVVVETGEESLMADLLDMTDPSKPREVVEIPRVEIPEADQNLLLPG